jgi:hypothetical protein
LTDRITPVTGIRTESHLKQSQPALTGLDIITGVDAVVSLGLFEVKGFMKNKSCGREILLLVYTSFANSVIFFHSVIVKAYDG